MGNVCSCSHTPYTTLVNIRVYAIWIKSPIEILLSVRATILTRLGIRLFGILKILFFMIRRICARLESRLHFLFQCHTLESCDHHRPHTHYCYNRMKSFGIISVSPFYSQKPNDKRHYERHTLKRPFDVLHCQINTIRVRLCVVGFD